MKRHLALFLFAIVIIIFPSCKTSGSSFIESASTTPSSSSAENHSDATPVSVTQTDPDTSSATATETSVAGTESVGSFSADDLKVILKGKNFGVTVDAAPLLKHLGSGYEYSEADSCAYAGKDKDFVYPDVTIHTIPMQAGKDIVDIITLTTGKYSTAKGVKIGATIDQIKAAYGNDYTNDGVAITFWAGQEGQVKTPKLIFEMTNNKVSSINILGGKSAG